MECIKTITKDCANDCPYNIKISHICKSSCLQTNKYYNKFTLFDIIQIFDFFFFLEMRIGGGISITISQDSYESTVLGRVLYCLNDMIHSAGCLGVSPTAMSNRSLITQQLHLNVHVKKTHRRNNVMERNNPFKTWAVV